MLFHRLLLLLGLASSLAAADFDLVVYGGTPAGLSASIVAAREGASVV